MSVLTARVGDRTFAAVDLDDFPGGAEEFLARYLPFGLHLVDVAGLDSIDAVGKLYRFLVAAGFECRFLAAGLREQDRSPTPAYAAEVAAYLESLTDAAATQIRQTIAVGMLHKLVLPRTAPPSSDSCASGTRSAPDSLQPGSASEFISQPKSMRSIAPP